MTPELKTFELRDVHTLIPVVAIRVIPTVRDEHYLWRRAGYGVGTAYVLLTSLVTTETQHDPFRWHGNRTMREAHLHIEANWSDLADGAVIDVGHMLGEYPDPKQSERHEALV